jgi:predicted RNase H-like HicB family nuclease
VKFVVVYEETTTGWSAYVPDLPGCVAAGETREETERLIREAIGMHVAALKADREPVPEPGTWTQTVEISA